jgi:hypothetical protein
MKRFLPIILSIAALGLFLQPAFADDASQRALASQLIDLIQGKESIRSNFDAVISNIIENMHQHGMPQDGVDEIKATVNKWYDSDVNFEDIRPKIVDAYVKIFSEDELKQLVAFCQSPLGAKAIKEMPGLMQTTAVVAQAYLKEKVPSLNADLTPIMTKYRDQMGATGGDAPGGPAPAPPGN